MTAWFISHEPIAERMIKRDLSWSSYDKEVIFPGISGHRVKKP